MKIYEYTPGFLHAKMMTIDGECALVGTPNVDARSLKLNFEVGLAIYNEEVTRQLDEIFSRTITESNPIDSKSWGERGIWPEIIQNFARLFSPVL